MSRTRGKAEPAFALWSCCQCSSGPYSIAIIPSCPYPTCISHHRCPECKLENPSLSFDGLPAGWKHGIAERGSGVDQGDRGPLPPSRQPAAPSRGATTIYDSGYGSASVPGVTAEPEQPSSGTGDVGADDRSVVTDDVSLHLSRDQVDTYVDAFARKLHESTKLETIHSDLIKCLPDLLRSFAVRVAAEEKSTPNKDVGTFVRRNKGYEVTGWPKGVSGGSPR